LTLPDHFVLDLDLARRRLEHADGDLSEAERERILGLLERGLGELHRRWSREHSDDTRDEAHDVATDAASGSNPVDRSGQVYSDGESEQWLRRIHEGNPDTPFIIVSDRALHRCHRLTSAQTTLIENVRRHPMAAPVIPPRLGTLIAGSEFADVRKLLTNQVLEQDDRWYLAEIIEDRVRRLGGRYMHREDRDAIHVDDDERPEMTMDYGRGCVGARKFT
jgi:hypothetical protein